MFDITIKPKEVPVQTVEDLLNEWTTGEMNVVEFKKHFNEHLIYFDNKTEELNKFLNELSANGVSDELLDRMWSFNITILNDSGWRSLVEDYPEMGADIEMLPIKDSKQDLTFSPWKRENTDFVNRNLTIENVILGLGYDSIYPIQLVNDFGYREFGNYLKDKFNMMDTDQINEFVSGLVSEHIGPVNPLSEIELI